MEQHRVVDFQFIAEEHALYVTLDNDPTDTWISGLDGAFDDELLRVPPAVADGNRVYLRVVDEDELDALALLLGYVDAANRCTKDGVLVRRIEIDPRPLRHLREHFDD